MKRVFEIGKDVKARKTKTRRDKVKVLMGMDLSDTSMGVKLQLIQDLIPLALIHVGDVMNSPRSKLRGIASVSLALRQNKGVLL
jgi:hypothetical protein